MEPKKSFNELIANPDLPVLVDFHATWCGPCQALAPVISDVAKEFGEKLKVIKIDVDKNPAVSQQFRVRGVPTIILFKGGEIKWQQSGMMTKRDLSAILTKFL